MTIYHMVRDHVIKQIQAIGRQNKNSTGGILSLWYCELTMDKGSIWNNLLLSNLRMELLEQQLYYIKNSYVNSWYLLRTSYVSITILRI